MAALPQPTAASAAPAPAPAGKLFLIFNDGSGHEEKTAVREAIEEELRRARRDFEFVPVAGGEIVKACQHAARQAVEAGGSLVAIGGDGTQNAAAQAAWMHGCALGVVAQGTFNLFARQLGLPLEPQAAVRALLRGTPEPVQVGLVNERVFLVNASVGLYPKLLADREVIKRKLGRRRWIAMLAALKTLMEWRLQLVLDTELDGEMKRVATPSLFVCNNRLQLERIGIEPKVLRAMDEGGLAGLFVRRLSTVAKLGLLWQALRGTLGESQVVESRVLRSLSVTTRHARRVKVATDGEVVWMQLPLRFAVAPRPLRVLLPPLHERLPVE